MAISKKLLLYGVLIFIIGAAIAATVTFFIVDNINNEVTTQNPNESQKPFWGYKCENSVCKRIEILPTNDASSLSVCRLTCNDEIGTLWPKPSGNVTFTKSVEAINPYQITIRTNNFRSNSDSWLTTWQRFREMQFTKTTFSDSNLLIGKPLLIEVDAESDDMSFTYETYEGYKIRISDTKDEIYAHISGKNFYGIRHGLETLCQLITYDEFTNSIVILSSAEIEDEPKFKHRGISFDSSRNFYPVEVIKRTINGLAMVKMNTFHWHITDSQSFPLEIKSHPQLAKLGAYSPDKIYTTENVIEIVKYAKARGVRVIPEFDVPAHVGEGWQNSGLVLCYKDLPSGVQWRGHFDPTQDKLYDYLEDIYREMVESFNPIVFHMGGDEVGVGCWNSSDSIKSWMLENGMPISIDGFMKLWSYFQENAIARLDKYMSEKVPIIVWTSSMTEDPYLSQLLDKDRYIVQIWTSGDDPRVMRLLEKGYKLIISNVDALYLDCGVGWWVDEGLNSCSPYKSWQKIYENKMEVIAENYINQIYGAETAIWSEAINEMTVDNRIWPRTSALAERLWSNPTTSWRRAEPRFLMHRIRLVEIGGIAAERIQLEWCLQNEGDCPAPW